MQNIGAHLAIIIDNKDNEEVDRVIMADDGTGINLTVPAMLISKKDGDILTNYLTKRADDEPELSLLAYFSLVGIILNIIRNAQTIELSMISGTLHR